MCFFLLFLFPPYGLPHSTQRRSYVNTNFSLYFYLFCKLFRNPRRRLFDIIKNCNEKQTYHFNYFVLTVLFPKGDSLIEPTFGNSSYTESEAVPHSGIRMIFGMHAHFGKTIYTAFHRTVVRDSVAFAHANKCCRLSVTVIVGMSRY